MMEILEQFTKFIMYGTMAVGATLFLIVSFFIIWGGVIYIVLIIASIIMRVLGYPRWFIDDAIDWIYDKYAIAYRYFVGKQ